MHPRTFVRSAACRVCRRLSLSVTKRVFVASRAVLFLAKCLSYLGAQGEPETQLQGVRVRGRHGEAR